MPEHRKTSSEVEYSISQDPKGGWWPLSYITPARRMSRLPVQLFARLVSATQALQRAGFDVIIAFGGLKTLREAAVRMYARQYEVALDADTEICILIGAKLAFRRSASAC